MKLDHTRFAFYGYIANRQSLLEELSLAAGSGIEALVNTAFNTWKLDFNQKVLGDFAVILPIDKQLDKHSDPECFICCSAFSSYRIFYQSNATEFSLSHRLSDFMPDALLNPVAIGQLFTQSYIVPPLTLVAGVRQLANGESQVWQIASKSNDFSASCLAHKTLTLMDKLKANKSSALFDPPSYYPLPQACVEQDVLRQDNSLKALQEGGFNAFMALPLLSRLLHEPVTQIRQIALLESLLEQANTNYVSRTGLYELPPTEAVQGEKKPIIKTAESIAQLNHSWDKASSAENKKLKALYTPIFKSDLRKAFKAQRQTQLQLRQEYQTQMLSFQGLELSHLELPSFELWLDLTVRLPNQWQQERQVAEALGKSVQFSCLNGRFMSQIFSQMKSAESDAPSDGLHQPNLSVIGNVSSGKYKSLQGYFQLEDDSLVNIYDAMQRLMMHGYKPVTKSLFKVVPPISAKLIKQTDQRQKVEAFCMKSLTLDHLSRQLNCTLAMS